MEFSDDHFALFGLPRCYALDEAALTRRYLEVQSSVHPDKHAHLSETEQRLAMQWTTRVNEAYQILRNPLRRARYLLSLAGIDADHGREMAHDFLVEQMEWREQVAQARAGADVDLLDRLHGRLQGDMARQYEKLAAAFADYPGAEADASALVLLRQLMFQEKLLHEIDDALAAAEA